MSAHLWGGIAWLGSTAYTVGQVRVNGSSSYVCTQSGTSAGSVGPTGTGTSIVDNTVRWDYAGNANSNVFIIGDLIEITIRGTTSYFTTGEIDVTWDNGTGSHVYLSSDPLFERSRVRQGADGSVDDVDVRVMHGGAAEGRRATWTALYLGHALAGAPFKVYEARFTTTRAIIGTILRFDGFVGPAQFGSTEGRMVVRSIASRLELPLPRNLLQPQCGWSLYDDGCGATEPHTWDAATTAAGSSISTIVMASTTVAADYFKLGTIEFLTGALASQYRMISGCYSSGGNTYLTVTPFLPVAPELSMSIRVRRGCSKRAGGDGVETAPQCDTYGRLVSMLGTPCAPRQDQVS